MLSVANRFIVVVLFFVISCGPQSRPTALWDLDGEALFDAPWPTDLKITDEGYPDLSGFPNSASLPIIEQYIDVAESQKGFGTTSAIYFPFDSPIDSAALPSPSQSLMEYAALKLFDVDSNSPHWGERIPVQWHFFEEPGTYHDANLLAVTPLYGYVLRPNTTYALVVTTDAANAAKGFADVWDEDSPLHDHFTPLDEALFFQDMDRKDVAVATVFSTTDPIAETDALARFTLENMESPVLSQALTFTEENLFYQVYEGTYDSPVFQHGERPYATEGGGFLFRDNGTPIIASWDEMRMAVSTPLDISEPPESGWPVVIYAHGTGGSYRSFCNKNSGLEVAAQFANAGLVGIGFDQPLHGTRATEGTDPNTHSFNYLNAEAARANFRQGALDVLYLARALASQETTFSSDNGQTIQLDPDRIMFMGHSHGGLTGALALPWLGSDLKAVVLSGAGGELSITLTERKDPYDIAEAIEALLNFEGNEVVMEFHPIVNLIQSLVEPTDPINYAPFWFKEKLDWEGQKPLPVLLTSGLLDEQTPFRTSEVLAAAAELPQLVPAITEPAVFTLKGLQAQPSPIESNVTTFEDTAVTAAFAQWEFENHFVVFENSQAAKLYRNFLKSTAAGSPTIEFIP